MDASTNLNQIGGPFYLPSSRTPTELAADAGTTSSIPDQISVGDGRFFITGPMRGDPGDRYIRGMFLDVLAPRRRAQSPTKE